MALYVHSYVSIVLEIIGMRGIMRFLCKKEKINKKDQRDNEKAKGFNF